jgi:dihydrofolate reductase
MTPTLSLIAAVARNGAIGNAGGLLWHLPEDLAHFRRTTMGRPVIMGRKTWESLPARFRPLPGRMNIVVTRQRGWHAEGASVAHDLDEALAHVRAAGQEHAFVIGGAQLYVEALSRADELVLTEIDAAFDGDAHFPSWDRRNFVEVAREHHRAAAPNDFAFDFATYRRTRSMP